MKTNARLNDRFFAIAVALGWVAIVSVANATTPQYQIYDIGVIDPGDDASQGFGVSHSGMAVGRSIRTGGSQAFSWTLQGGIVGLPNLAGRNHAVANSAADQTVVGTAATTLFGSAALGSRKEVLAKYQASLSIKGDVASGKKVFETACATCHRAGDLGKDVGPNLATIRQWNPDQVLGSILDPNREVAPNFLSYTLETKDGRTLDGIIAEESAASLTLKRAEGVTETVLRRDIAQLSGSGLSLMPEGLEAGITIEQMADLIAFLLSPP